MGHYQLSVDDQRVERLIHEPAFVAMLDALLPIVIGPLVQTFGAAGPDGGVDADYRGEISGVSGYWVFQYKFRDPRTSGVGSRKQVARALEKSGFQRVVDVLKAEGEPAPCGYILITNVEATPKWARDLARKWRECAPESEFAVWDRSRLNSILKVHSHVGVRRSAVLSAASHQAVVEPLWDWTEHLAFAVNLESPAWLMNLLRVDGAGPSSPYALERTVPAITTEQPLLSDAFDVSWRNSLRHYDEVVGLLTESADWIFELVEDTARRILLADVWPTDVKEAWDRDGHGIAHALWEDVVRGAGEMRFRIGLRDDGRLEIGGRGFLDGCEPSQLAAFHNYLRSEFARLVALDWMADAPRAVRELPRAIGIHRNALWYAATLKIDAPRNPTV